MGLNKSLCAIASRNSENFFNFSVFSFNDDTLMKSSCALLNYLEEPIQLIGTSGDFFFFNDLFSIEHPVVR